MREEFGGHDGADRVAAMVFCAGVARPVAEKPRQRCGRAWCQCAAQHVDRGQFGDRHREILCSHSRQIVSAARLSMPVGRALANLPRHRGNRRGPVQFSVPWAKASASAVRRGHRHQLPLRHGPVVHSFAGGRGPSHLQCCAAAHPSDIARTGYGKTMWHACGCGARQSPVGQPRYCTALMDGRSGLCGKVERQCLPFQPRALIGPDIALQPGTIGNRVQGVAVHPGAGAE